MQTALTLHPDSRCVAVTRIDVDAVRPSASQLQLRYVVHGRIVDLRLPPVVAAKRSDGLWHHTCFEALVRAGPGPAYLEVNIAPSTQWAAYGFDGYRTGMRVAREFRTPHIEFRSNGDTCTVQASLTLDGVPELTGDAPWQIGLSAVIEESGGRISYWALAHPPGRPDFHHSDCFALELPAA